MNAPPGPRVVAVAGSSPCTPREAEDAEAVGRLLAERGAVLVCGGLGGVMEAACRGTHEAGGLAVGLLPGSDRTAANPYVAVALPTGLGEGRNVLVARAGDALIAIGRGYGTLSEVALALKIGTPVVALGSWGPDRLGDAPGLREASSPEEAVALALG